jgi:hypothetical protein
VADVALVVVVVPADASEDDGTEVDETFVCKGESEVTSDEVSFESFELLQAKRKKELMVNTDNIFFIVVIF